MKVGRLMPFRGAVGERLPEVLASRSDTGKDPSAYVVHHFIKRRTHAVSDHHIFPAPEKQTRLC